MGFQLPTSTVFLPDFSHQQYEQLSFKKRCFLFLRREGEKVAWKFWAFCLIFLYVTPLKFNIHTQNRHIWKEIRFKIHHFGHTSQIFRGYMYNIFEYLGFSLIRRGFISRTLSWFYFLRILAYNNQVEKMSCKENFQTPGVGSNFNLDFQRFWWFGSFFSMGFLLKKIAKSESNYHFGRNMSGQIIVISAELTPNRGLVRESPPKTP